jgi:hypothetical protein
MQMFIAADARRGEDRPHRLALPFRAETTILHVAVRSTGRDSTYGVWGMAAGAGGVRKP